MILLNMILFWENNSLEKCDLIEVFIWKKNILKSLQQILSFIHLIDSF